MRTAIAASLLALVCHHAGAQGGYVVQTFGNPDAVNVEFGTNIAVVGDLDGDARDDYLVGDPHAMTLWGGGGDVRLVSGATGATIRAHQGNPGSGPFGGVLAGVGDLDFDGVPDYALGSPYFGAVQSWGGSPPAYLSAPGKVSLWSGSTGAPLFTVTGSTTVVPGAGYGGGSLTLGDNLGTSICAPGDVTGDGIPDLVIGAPGAAPGGQIQTGKFVVRSGASGAVITVYGSSAGQLLGGNVRAPGDLDGDGIGDIVVSGWGGNGFVSAYSGVSLTVLWTANAPLTSPFGPSGFGSNLSPAGDVNGDGVNDVVVGAPLGIALGQNLPGPPGQAFVLSGPTGQQLCSMTGTTSGESFGSQCSKAGDINGDGFADVLVSSPNFGFPNTGRVQLFLGPSCAAGQVVALATLPSDQLGRGLAGGAFLDADGVPDILIGAPEYPSPGRVLARSGATFAGLYQIHGVPASFPSGRFSTAVDAGDQDGDGNPDVALGLGSPGSFSNSSILLVSGITSQIIRTLPGPAVFYNSDLHLPVVCPGDIDGDGYKDFAVASAAGLASIELRVVSGFSAAVLYTMTWPKCGLSGVRMVASSDVDGDGIRDLVIGLPVASACSPPAIGLVELRSGATGALIAQASGAAASDDFAASLASVGDLNGDGVADLLVGAPATALDLSGSVLVRSGTTLAPLFTITGNPDQGLGTAVAGIGDVTGDGIPDFAATEGQPLYLPVVRLFSGAGGAAIGAIPSPPAPVAGFGSGIAGVGDVNGDGMPDIAVSAPWTTLSTSPPPNYIGEVFVFSGAGGPALFRVPGRYANENLGATLASLGDRNDDGLADVFAGAGYTSGAHAEILSFAGVPSGSHVIGTACVLASGRKPSLAAFGGDPTSSVGNPAFGLIVSNGTAGCPGAIAAGLSTSSWAGVSLPLALGPGLPGCSQYVSVDALVAFVVPGPAGGLGAVPLPISVPVAPSLAGATVHFQAYLADSPLATLPGAVTRGLTIVVQ
jgi:FG-GAP repeat